MSSSGFSLSPDIERPGCHRVQGLIACGMFLALAALAGGGLPGPWAAVVAALIVGAGYCHLKRASPRHPAYVVRIRVRGDGGFQIAVAGNPDVLVPAGVKRHWMLPGVAVGLVFAGEQAGDRQALLFRDRVPPDSWRRLAVCLRLGGGRPVNETRFT